MIEKCRMVSNNLNAAKYKISPFIVKSMNLILPALLITRSLEKYFFTHIPQYLTVGWIENLERPLTSDYFTTYHMIFVLVEYLIFF